MVDTEGANPYDKPNLRSAWKSGWDAFWEGKREAPSDAQYESEEEKRAWLDGYAEAQAYGGGSKQG